MLSPLRRYRSALTLVLLAVATNLFTIDSLGCNPGTYFDNTKCSRCPGGTFGERPGLTTPRCSGACAGGYFCPEGSTSARANLCGRSIYYCPPGSATRQLVAAGYYTIVSQRDPSFVAPLATSLHKSNHNAAPQQLMCEPGYYCEHGIRYPCAAGSFGEVYGQRHAACTGTCPKGFYCPLATAHPIPCPLGTFGNALGLSNTSCNGLCPRGFYCESGTVTPVPCPAGTLGRTLGLATADCSTQCTQLGSRAPFTTVCVPSRCPAGYYCPLGATNAIACGSASMFCPTGSIAPTSVTSGFYTTSTSSLSRVDSNALAVTAAATATQSAQHVCEKGSYCVSGVKQLCPAGVYGATLGLATASCTAPCPVGYYCPVGSVDATAHPCTASDVFCHEGSMMPTRVSIGFYTTTLLTGTTAPLSLRVDQLICPLGSYCVDGVATPCPVSTYGATTGLATPLCSGRCQDGYTCALGSTSATQLACPAGSYSQNGMRCSPCAPGFWCTAGSSSREQHACGGDTTFCPLGSAAPLAVQSGFFAVGQQPTTHTAQMRCVVRNAPHVPHCPTRTVGAFSGM